MNHSNISSHKYIEKWIRGKHSKQSFLPEIFEGTISMGPIGEVLKSPMWDIDSEGNCPYDAKHYLNLFKEIIRSKHPNYLVLYGDKF